MSRFSIAASIVLVCAPPVIAETASAPFGSTEGWPRFGGPRGDFSVASPIATTWPEDGPELLWERTLGDGYSGVTADNRGRLYTAYRDGEHNATVALDATSGEVSWVHRTPIVVREPNTTQFGIGPRATPLVHGDLVVTLAYDGALTALDRATGEPRWQHQLVDDFDGEAQMFGVSASPILHAGRVVVLVGGTETAAVVAFDPATGAPVWKSPAGTVSYATPIVADPDGDGDDDLLYFAQDGLVALDPETGVHRWRHEIVNGYRNHAAQPIVGDDGVVWAVTQQEGAARALRIAKTEDGTFGVERLWSNNKVQVHHWGSVRRGDAVFATIGGQGNVLAAIDVTSGKVLWRERGFAKASFLETPSGTLLLDEDRTLALVDLRRDGLEVRARTTLPGNGVTWTPPTLVGGVLYVRDKEALRAFDLRATGAEAPAAEGP